MRIEWFLLQLAAKLALLAGIHDLPLHHQCGRRRALRNPIKRGEWGCDDLSQ